MTHNRSAGTLLAFIAGIAVWAFFGETIKEKFKGRKDWNDLKKEVEKKYSQAQEYSQEAYDKVVDEVVGRYAKAKDISENELVDLVEDLKMHWGRIKNAWN